MNALNATTTNGAPRRNFFRLAGATVLGLSGLASAASRAQAATPVGDGPNWPGKLCQRLLLGQALLLPDPLDVPPDELAHIHAREVSGLSSPNFFGG